jgi:hypothetical protein
MTLGVSTITESITEMLAFAMKKCHDGVAVPGLQA